MTRAAFLLATTRYRPWSFTYKVRLVLVLFVLGQLLFILLVLHGVCCWAMCCVSASAGTCSEQIQYLIILLVVLFTVFLIGEARNQDKGCSLLKRKRAFLCGLSPLCSIFATTTWGSSRDPIGFVIFCNLLIESSKSGVVMTAWIYGENLEQFVIPKSGLQNSCSVSVQLQLFFCTTIINPPLFNLWVKSVKGVQLKQWGGGDAVLLFLMEGFLEEGTNRT